MPSARARHILVKSEDSCTALKQEIADGANFAAVAKEHSQCPSGQQGGDLGEFKPGQMVPEFDKWYLARKSVKCMVQSRLNLDITWSRSRTGRRRHGHFQAFCGLLLFTHGAFPTVLTNRN